MIHTIPFGRTGHLSSRIIFGGWALSNATQAEADRVLDRLLEWGINHIDTALAYGNAEKRIGNWMKKHRDKFFLATKSRSRSPNKARKDLHRSLTQLQVDQIDLWQIHSLANPQSWEKVMAPGGVLDVFIEARDQGLVRYLGVTGHGSKIAKMHLRSLERFDFDTVLLPYNFLAMQNPRYAKDFSAVVELCRQRNVAVQTIKSITRQPWGDRPHTYNTYFYLPLEDQEAIDKSVHWALGLQDSFVITAGDIRLIPKMLEAAKRFEQRPSDTKMQALVEKYDIQPYLPY
jgi:aryl-alcohol dehydrogenase-like predicted oxidoreductase